MFRYLALVWNDRSLSQSQHANVLATALRLQPRAWHSVLNVAGARIWSAGSCANFLGPAVLPDEGGVILGRVFRQDGGDPRAALAAATTAVDRERTLIDRCWGRYVAVLRDTSARKTLIVRDPSGAMRCFHVAKEGVHIVCSHTEDCVSLGLRFTINWNYVAAELANRAGMGWDQTGLSEISAVRAGERLEIADDTVRKHLCWDPVRIATRYLEDAREGAREIRRTVRGCVQAWASCHAHVGLLLSGGLDSSVVLSCLRNASDRPLVSCLNYFHETPRADERTYARLAAQRADCELIELQRSTAVRLESLLGLPRSARPSHNRLDQVLHAERSARWARGVGATAVFTGDLGDQLFGQQLGGYASVDYAQRHGVSRRLFVVSRDVARLREGAIWSPLTAGLAYGWLSRQRSLRRFAIRVHAREANPYVNHRVLDQFDYRLRDRWMESVNELPIGKLHHVSSMLSGQAYLTPVGGDDDLEWVAPLNSQPIIEMCLRLPLWLMIEGGWDRSLFRRAFARDVPSQIAWRRTKGTTSTQRVAVYSGNAAFLRTLLLEGVLASSGLLDVAALAKDLHAEDYRKNLWLERCIRAETWLRIWDAGPSSSIPYMSCPARYVYRSAS